MINRGSFGRAAAVCGMFAIFSFAGNGLDGVLGYRFVGVAEAKTVVIQRTTVYINTLPKGCVKTTYSGGIVVWKCGTKYYQPYNNRYVLVYIK
ncbi:hypothetical protein CN311_07380 [Mesorhizobium sanjuanii]|uniref:Uncharacterized protein n=1 Tax=Mesorhizobium sanjuanii TaxID=2037900 RepID=A0A2A6FIH9_9HYPH|nr:hypothetical protein [Mesorhizobium sanjuanii]PDQ21789.1 hypothetical protein CN311_07380 [Mesorhizobium sanjuanii]